MEYEKKCVVRIFIDDTYLLIFLNFSQFVDSHKTSRLKEKSGAALEYAIEGDVSVDIYKDSWPLANHMMWYIPACVRDADSVSIGDSESHSTTTKSSDMSFDMNEFDENGLPSSSCSMTSVQTRKSRGRSDDFESTFQNVASTFVSFLEKQTGEKITQSTLSQQTGKKLKYVEMYEELDKVLENVNFLDAVKFLTNTIDAAIDKFPKKSE